MLKTLILKAKSFLLKIRDERQDRISKTLVTLIIMYVVFCVVVMCFVVMVKKKKYDPDLKKHPH